MDWERLRRRTGASPSPPSHFGASLPGCRLDGPTSGHTDPHAAVVLADGVSPPVDPSPLSACFADASPTLIYCERERSFHLTRLHAVRTQGTPNSGGY